MFKDWEAFAQEVLGEGVEFIIEEYDGARLYLLIEGEEFLIRLWDLVGDKIRWTLYKCVEDYGQEIKAGETKYIM